MFDVRTMTQVEKTGSRNEKEALLSKLDKRTVRLVALALDPMVTFGVTVEPKESFEDYTVGQDVPELSLWWDLFEGVAGQLRSRDLTGNAAELALKSLFDSVPDPSADRWARRILNRDLRCGMGWKTLNNVFPKTIEPFSCSLAEEWDGERLDGVYFVEPKLDGLRMVVLDGVAYTRNGRTIDTVGHVLKELEQFQDDYVFDGEVIGDVDFDEGSGKARRKGTGPDHDLRYHIFDVIPRSEWISRSPLLNLTERKNIIQTEIWPALLGIQNVLGTKGSVIVPWMCGDSYDPEEVKAVVDKHVKDGYEGAMFKFASATYQFRRTSFVLKGKPFQTADGTVKGAYEGKGRLKDKLGGLEVDFDGVVTRVGSGFSDGQRDQIWKLYLEGKLSGKVAECEFQAKTPAGKLRFPRFLRFRPDKELL